MANFVRRRKKFRPQCKFISSADEIFFIYALSSTRCLRNGFYCVKSGEIKACFHFFEATEWMQGATSWTTHTVKFSLSAATDLTISLGYGTDNNNFPTANTPVLYISHLALNTVSDTEALDEAKAKWQAAWDAADTANNDGTYDLVGGKERADLNAEIAKDEPTTIEGYEEATAALIAATKTFIDATPYWDALDREIGKAGLLGVSTQDAEDVFNDEATGIQALDVLNAGTAVIYNASGVRQNSLQRGLNIVKMQDGSVRKVMVK